MWAQVQVCSYLGRPGWDVSCPPLSLALTFLAHQPNNFRLLTGALEQLSFPRGAAHRSEGQEAAISRTSG